MLVTGVFDRFQEALGAASELVEEGFVPKSLSLMARADRHRAADVTSNGWESWSLGLSDAFETFSVRCGRGDVTPVWSNGPLAAALHDGFGGGAFLDALAAAGLGRAAAWYFVDAVCSGHVLLSVHCDENRVRVARNILNGHSKPRAARGQAGIRARDRQDKTPATRCETGRAPGQSEVSRGSRRLPGEHTVVDDARLSASLW